MSNAGLGMLCCRWYNYCHQQQNQQSQAEKRGEILSAITDKISDGTKLAPPTPNSFQEQQDFCSHFIAHCKELVYSNPPQHKCKCDRDSKLRCTGTGQDFYKIYAWDTAIIDYHPP
ncbi:MAG TPA: hypothetical protein VK211_19135 [Kamptonema sp.]|nr:hypothetical protein [Kamptonema sp.]